MNPIQVEVNDGASADTGKDWVEIVFADKSHPLADLVVIECVRYAFPQVCELLNLERAEAE